MSSSLLRTFPALGLLLVTVASSACDNPRPLSEPRPQDLSRAAPDSFVVAVETSKGDFEVTMYREWSPVAVDRAYYLMNHSFYDGARFYRVNAQYAQFGFSGQPALDSLWKPLTLPDEPVRASNVRGAVTFARAGPESRNYVLFINLRDNTFLDTWSGDGVEGFPPIGLVTNGLEVTGALDDQFGDELMIFEDSILAEGNAFFTRSYPQLDSIVSVQVVRRW